MTINTDLLLEIREQITSHPETHDPHRCIVCGEVQCVCGRWNGSA